MKQKFGVKGQSLLRNLLAGLKEAKSKWQVRYEQATSEEMRKIAIMRVNHYNEESEAYSKMLKEGVRV